MDPLAPLLEHGAKRVTIVVTTKHVEAILAQLHRLLAQAPLEALCVFIDGHRHQSYQTLACPAIREPVDLELVPHPPFKNGRPPRFVDKKQPNKEPLLCVPTLLFSSCAGVKLNRPGMMNLTRFIDLTTTTSLFLHGDVVFSEPEQAFVNRVSLDMSFCPRVFQAERFGAALAALSRIPSLRHLTLRLDRPSAWDYISYEYPALFEAVVNAWQHLPPQLSSLAILSHAAPRLTGDGDGLLDARALAAEMMYEYGDGANLVEIIDVIRHQNDPLSAPHPAQGDSEQPRRPCDCPLLCSRL